MRRTRTEPAVLITTAPETIDHDYVYRRRRYAIMMTLRAVCVLAAALTYHVSVYLALAFVGAGVVLPWCAVILANDRLPNKARAERFHGTPGERALPSGSDDRVIDG